MNILGQPFAPWVTKQINVRQTSLGNSTNLTNTNLLYQNTRSPWLRLASTVDIEAIEGKNTNFTKLAQLGLDDVLIQGDTPARNFILQGGVSKIIGTDTSIEEGTGTLLAGLNSTNQIYSGAYGWGGLDQRGYAPMPGITGATVKYLSNGALAKADIQMKCFTRNQLALMDVLYMRPGYNLLLEFGWSHYLDNLGELQTFNNFFSPALSFVFNPQSQESSTPTHFDVLDLIQTERYNRQGNYEGVFGKVTNFNWSFNPDGSYDCTVNLTGMGDMMESLKVNLKLDSKDDGDQEKKESDQEVGETTQPPLIANKDKTTLNKVLYGLFEQGKGSAESDTYQPITIPAFPASVVTIDENGNTTNKFEIEDLTIKNGMLSLFDTTTDVEENSSPQVYITFGSLLALIQKHLLLYTSKGIPLFDFDVNFKDIENDENYIVNIPSQFSSNPLVCLIPYQGIPEGVADDIGIPKTSINETLLKNASAFQTDKGDYLGKLCGIFLNINNIALILDKSKRSDDGSLSLLTFLNNIISSFTTALGGINIISIKVDEVTQKVRFIENAPQRFSKTPSTSEYARINTFGVKPDTQGSFVRNIVMGGELGPRYASMIAIGAQIAGNQLSANATGFGAYNLGLKDRVIPQKLNSGFVASTPDEASEEEAKSITDVWNKQINLQEEGGNSLFWSIYNQRLFTEIDVNALTLLNQKFLSLISGKLVEMRQLQSPSFLPFNLSFDIDGLSGMKLFEKFLIDDNVLPPSYGEGNVDLLVKSLNHSVTPSNWTTQIDTQAAPTKILDPVAKPRNLESFTTTQGSATGGGGGSVGNLGDFQTLTSGFPMAKIFYDGPTPKTQIVIHHTAGRQNPEKTIRSWSKRTDHVATHYITNNDGAKEQLFADEAWANHLGIKSSTFKQLGIPFKNLNKTTLSIEMQAFGGLKLKDNKYYTYVNSEMPSDRVARPVDKNGNPTTYKGYSYYEKYSEANIQKVKEIIQGWQNKYNIPFTYNYDELFPNDGTVTPNAFKGVPGIYTHNSFRTGKSDVFPQAELIAMLKSLSSGSSGGNTSTSSTFIYNPQKASESITPPTNTLQAGDIVTVTINYDDGENIGTGAGTATVQSLSRRDVAIRSARLKAKGSLTDQFSN
tara:strand:- start:269 stop:3652 length:3384 start_codon:yes stop_codon:yes gene_type:complete